MYANRNKQLTVVIGITLTLLACLGGCSKIEPVTNNLRPALAYRIGTISGVETDLYPGEIRARHEADHAFRISGKMVARLVDAGSVVKRGQQLARLDPQDTKLAADATNANAAAAETEATFADAEYRRFKDLFAKGFVSQSALDQKLNVANAAKARLESARAQASVSINQAGYAVLTAEQDGVVTQVMAESGQVVTAGQAVLRIADPGEKELSISVPEARIGEFRSAGTSGAAPRALRVATWSFPDKYYQGKVREVGASADPVTRTYPVRVSIKNTDESVQLGMTAFALFVGAADSDTLAVPLSSLYVKGTITGVWQIANDGRVSLKPVNVLQYKENVALIKGGVKAGDLIVAAGVHKLREGEVVKPVTDPQVTGDGKVAHAPIDQVQAQQQVAARGSRN